MAIELLHGDTAMGGGEICGLRLIFDHFGTVFVTGLGLLRRRAHAERHGRGVHAEGRDVRAEGEGPDDGGGAGAGEAQEEGASI